MIPATITSILNTQATSKPGIQGLYAIAKDQITDMPDLLSILGSTAPNAALLDISDIILASGAAVNEISNDNNLGTEMTETPKTSVHGPFFGYEVTFSIPNDDEVTRGRILRAFDNREWIVIVRQASNQWRILGNLHRGCDWRASLGTGSNIKGLSVYKCGFYWESSERALYINTF